MDAFKAWVKEIRKAKSMLANRIRLELRWLQLFDPVASEIFYFKHDVRSSLTIIFIGNPNFDNIGSKILVQS